jgi:tyrosine-protein kinase Etk/Wzc
MRNQFAIQDDTVDIADVIGTLKRQWRAVIAFLALGVLGALAVVLFAPRRFDGKTSVVVSPGGSDGGSVLGRMGTGINNLLGGLGGMGGTAGFETELQVLRSRVLAGQVVDSLRLQVRVREPAGVAPSALVQSYDLASSFGPRKYVFQRDANGAYRVQGPGDGADRVVTPGQPARLDVGNVTLASQGLPSSFEVVVLDREDAIDRFQRRLNAGKGGGLLATIAFRADDSLTAAAAPNALLHFYLERRRTVDRGANQKKLDTVTAQVKATAAELAATERQLRLSQEATGIFDAEVWDKSQEESASRIRESLIQLQVDEGALKQLLAQADKGTLSARDLVAYPSLGSVGALANRLSELEVARTTLLERRTERDPEVITLDRNIQALNTAIVSMANSYLSSVTKRRAHMETQLATVQQRLMTLPSAGERVERLKRDVLRLTQIYTALQAQLVEARLAAIGEGGDVRQVDVAVVPRGPSFPQPFFTMGVGTVGGLVAGLVAALFMGLFGRWYRDPVEIERAIGIAAERFQADAPLLMAGSAPSRTLLVVPLDQRAQAGMVAERLARTATARLLPVTLLDLNGNGVVAGGVSGNGSPSAIDHSVVNKIDQLEQQSGVLVVQLPGLGSDITLAAMRETRPVLLVAPPGPVNRLQLTRAVEMLRRLQVPCAGIVMSDDAGRHVARALI